MIFFSWPFWGHDRWEGLNYLKRQSLESIPASISFKWRYWRQNLELVTLSLLDAEYSNKNLIIVPYSLV